MRERKGIEKFKEKREMLKGRKGWKEKEHMMAGKGGRGMETMDQKEGSKKWESRMKRRKKKGENNEKG